MINKPTKIRSRKIRNSAKGEPCTLRLIRTCNNNPETTVFAHLPGNKGTATKNHDLFGVYACSDCHRALDSGIVSYNEQMRALQETLIKLYQKGLIKVE